MVTLLFLLYVSASALSYSILFRRAPIVEDAPVRFEVLAGGDRELPRAA